MTYPIPTEAWADLVDWPSPSECQRTVLPMDRHFANIPSLLVLKPKDGASGIVVVHQSRSQASAIDDLNGMAMRTVTVYASGFEPKFHRLPVASFLCFCDHTFLSEKMLNTPPPKGVSKKGHHAYYAFRNEEPTKTIYDLLPQETLEEFIPLKEQPTLSVDLCPTCGKDELACSLECEDDPCCCRVAKQPVIEESLADKARELFATYN